MLGIGGWEIALIAIFGFLIFGPDKLPAIARTIGRGIRQFRTAQDQMNKVIKSEVYDPIKDLEPLANPFAGFSLDPSKDPKSGTNTTTTSAAKTATKPNTTAASNFDAVNVEPKKVSGDEMKAAIAAQSAKTITSSATKDSNKDQTAKSAAKPGESFAERRARLEKEHAKAKAAKTESTAKTGASAKTKTAVKVDADATSAREEDKGGN